VEPLSKQFLRILQYTPTLSPPFSTYGTSLFLPTEQLNKLYIKTHNSKLQWKENTPPFATGKLKQVIMKHSSIFFNIFTQMPVLFYITGYYICLLMII
jgi:hypothetical protein